MKLLEIEYTVPKIKCSLNEINSRLNTAEENTSELEDISNETIQSESERKKRLEQLNRD